MWRLIFKPRDTGRAALTLARAGSAALALWMAVPAFARAECFEVSEPAYQTLDPLVSKNATQALSAVSARLRELERSGSAANPRELAALYAVQADADSILELDDQAVAAATRGLALVSGVTDPLRLELLYTIAYNVRTQAQIHDTLDTIQKARAQQPPNSLSGVCLAIAQGVLESRTGQYALATRTDTIAYRDSEAPERAGAHALAAMELSSALQGVGDYEQSLMLAREGVAWYAKRADALQIAVGEWMEGHILTAMREFRAAIATFEHARSISVSLGDQQGVAWDDMEICGALIQLNEFAAARPRCRDATPVFIASKSTYALKEVEEHLAEIDLHEGHAQQALATLNHVLDHDGTDMEPNAVGDAYLARAQAYGALHNYRRAYPDLMEYLRRYRADNLARRMRLQATVKERLMAEQEIARNALLQHQLEVTRQRATRQTQTLHWVGAVGTAGAVLLALLSYILITNLRYRRQLLRLAREDNLTGMPNRGRTAELATAALQAAAEEARPLTIAIIDLDHFKAINDRCGHAGGDHVLKEFARISRGSLREADTLGRWGGEEFLLILPDTTLDAALASVERLRALALAIQVPQSSADDPVRVTFSAGLATTTEGANSLDEIIARADAALYEAKHEGRDLVRIDRESYQSASTGVRRALRIR